MVERKWKKEYILSFGKEEKWKDIKENLWLFSIQALYFQSSQNGRKRGEKMYYIVDLTTLLVNFF